MIPFISNFLAKRRAAAEERERQCVSGIAKIVDALKELQTLPESYQSFADWLKKHEPLYNDVMRSRNYGKCPSFMLFAAQVSTFDDVWKKATHKTEVLRQNEACLIEKSNIDDIARSLGFLFCDPMEYIDKVALDHWKTKNGTFVTNLQREGNSRFGLSEHHSEYQKSKEWLLKDYKNLDSKVKEHDDTVLQNRINDGYKTIGDVEGRRLDRQQMECIVNDARNQLVVAGAGTGKTTTIVGKVKYLLAKGGCGPDDILVLSFMKKSADEMKIRLKNEIGKPIEARTFNGYGYQIISAVEKCRPNVIQDEQGRNIIRETLLDQLKDDHYVSLLLQFLLYNKSRIKTEFDFDSREEYEEYLRESMTPLMPLLNGNSYKSGGEIDIANFLVMNGIRAQYEAKYPVNTCTEEYPKQYEPDFFLPDYGIYIEYFGIDRNGHVPDYFSSRHGKTPSKEYVDSMNWKRKLHAEHGTKMVEVFAYERFEGNLIECLTSRLKECGVEFRPVSPHEIWEKVLKETHFAARDRLTTLFTSLLSLCKSNEISAGELRTRNAFAIIDDNEKADNDDVITLFTPIYEGYQKALATANAIDFNDMVNKAAAYIRKGEYSKNWKYVIVDEYQDISKARFKLLKALRDSHDYKLFCVGDDWQSIYRFNGSDVNFILNFEKYWGETCESRIETTYRFNKRLIEASGEFVMRNPAQKRKSLKTQSTESKCAIGSGIWPWRFRPEDMPDGSTVFFIGRYNNDIELIEKDFMLGQFAHDFQIVRGGRDGKTVERIIFRPRPKLDIRFITVHQSKGLQADYVFILNNHNGRKGFPSQIEDEPILNLLLENAESYPFAEERRLYYVAMTRAKKKVFFVPPKQGEESDFYQEILHSHRSEIRAEGYECPICGNRMRECKSAGGSFFACSNNNQSGHGNYTRPIRHRVS